MSDTDMTTEVIVDNLKKNILDLKIDLRKVEEYLSENPLTEDTLRTFEQAEDEKVKSEKEFENEE